jgi:hypothetical protein
MPSSPHAATNLEALLRDMCRRALSPGMTFDNQLRLYRAAIALAREVRLRFGGAMPDANAQTLAAHLAEVSEHASALGVDPDLSLHEALQVQRLAVQLSRASRQAGAAEPAGRAIFTQDAMHREEPAQPEAPEPVEPPIPPQHPLQRETEAPDDRLRAWRRDQRAHDRPRSVVDAPPVAKAEPMNKRDWEERNAA